MVAVKYSVIFSITWKGEIKYFICSLICIFVWLFLNVEAFFSFHFWTSGIFPLHSGWTNGFWGLYWTDGTQNDGRDCWHAGTQGAPICLCTGQSVNSERVIVVLKLGQVEAKDQSGTFYQCERTYKKTLSLVKSQSFFIFSIDRLWQIKF